MDNLICFLLVRNGPLTPAQAEVWITVFAEYQTPTTEVRGRLMGPRCRYSTTVEVAYPLRLPPPQNVPPGALGITMRVFIPEASLWEPESPFLYQGPIELWQDGRRCDQVHLSHGLRDVSLGERGLRLNSRPLTLRGRAVTACSEEEALALRQTGCNLLVAPVEANTLDLVERADRLGFFLLGRIRDQSEQTLRHLWMLSLHTSCLGWLIEEGMHLPLDDLPPRCLVGLVCASASPEVPVGVNFLVGPAELANLGKPVLVMGEGPGPTADPSRNLGSVV
jgi:hypothetical protein